MWAQSAQWGPLLIDNWSKIPSCEFSSVKKKIILRIGIHCNLKLYHDSWGWRKSQHDPALKIVTFKVIMLDIIQGQVFWSICLLLKYMVPIHLFTLIMVSLVHNLLELIYIDRKFLFHIDIYTYHLQWEDLYNGNIDVKCAKLQHNCDWYWR